MKVHEIMTAHAKCVAPDNTLVEVAGLMRELDVGALPICENDRLAGMVTDRDIVLRGVADGRDAYGTTARDVMSPGIFYVFADQEVEEAVRLMEEKQIRRLPVLGRDKRLVGIVSLGDIAVSSNPAFSGMALKEVSEPGGSNAQNHASPSMRRMHETTRAPSATRSRGARKSRQASAGAARIKKSTHKPKAKARRASATRSTTRAKASPSRRRKSASRR